MGAQYDKVASVADRTVCTQANMIGNGWQRRMRIAEMQRTATNSPESTDPAKLQIGAANKRLSYQEFEKTIVCFFTEQRPDQVVRCIT